MNSRQTKTVLPAVVKSLVVDCAPRDAFRYFTTDIGRWWPLATHSCIASASEGTKAPESCVFETRAGGRIYECGVNDEEHEWGVVTLWEPPSKVAFTWHPGRRPETAQIVEVTFAPDPHGTRVVLTHTHWESLGDEAAATREGYENGWETVFIQEFGTYANGKVSEHSRENEQ